MEDETGDTYFLHAPTIVGDVSIFHYLVSGGSIAQKLWKAFRPYAPEAEEILEDLPWE